jgi:hypothetical protein
MTRMVSQQGLISDANVLIDYAKSTPSVLRLISQHLQQLYVASPVLAEVHDFSAEQIVKLRNQDCGALIETTCRGWCTTSDKEIDFGFGCPLFCYG